jgi:hypothetical protein
MTPDWAVPPVGRPGAWEVRSAAFCGTGVEVSEEVDGDAGNKTAGVVPGSKNRC